MKKFLIIVIAVIVAVLGIDALYYRVGLYIDFAPNKEVSAVSYTKDGLIYKSGENGEGEVFEIKGVNLGSGEPGHWSTEYVTSKETYLIWFKQMKEMGANTVRIYTVLSEDFYEAFYEYNKDNPDPLYLIQGVWVNDYVLNSHHDIFSEEFYGTFYEYAKTAVDVIHGTKKIFKNQYESVGYGTYKKDVSEWVIGYIWGVEWEDLTVAYANEKYRDDEEYNSYSGKYLYTSEDATPFETMLTMVGDHVIDYESKRYKQQRAFAFANWPTTDPFEYPENVAKFFKKCATVNVENIKCTEKIVSGQFASYHVYPYYPDYLSYITDEDWGMLGVGEKADYSVGEGKTNTYKAYLQMLNNHHEIPVVISEFGVSTGRGMAQEDYNTGRNQGNMSEKEQGEALVSCYNDIIESGCVGSCVFSWQDEWFKRTWNTMYAVNLEKTPYWSDYQTNEQYFGLLSFDPGNEKSVCYVDGDISEWTEKDIVITNKDGSSVSMKYDEKFVYIMVKKDGFDINNDKLYIPIDTTQKSGSNYCENYDIRFDRAVDFLIVIDGKDNSRMLVQERYESIRSTYSEEFYGFNTYIQGNIPEKNSPIFKKIYMILQIDPAHTDMSSFYETGLLTYGNANPDSVDFNSLADFNAGEGYIEIKLPWQILNFFDPSMMKIHDDYYEKYGVEGMIIDEMFIGVCDEVDSERVELGSVKLEAWGEDVTYHERLKQSYYILQSVWKQD